MASTPDSHPDSLPPEQPGTPEQVDADFDGRNRRESVEPPVESAGSDGGTAGTTDNRVQDDLAR